MNPKQLIHDQSKVHAVLKELPDGRLVTTKGCKIYIPSRYAERGLAFIGIETQIVGIFAISVEDKYYGIHMVNAMVRIEPTSTSKIMINEEEHYEFEFEPGAPVISSTMLVKTDTLVYRISNEIVTKGRVPWYLNYFTLSELFDTARYHAGANIGQNHEVTELLISMIARNPDDRHQYYRSSVKSLDDIEKKPPAFVALRSVIYSATNTTNKLAGSYFHEGLVSALVTPTERVERIEDLLRR